MIPALWISKTGLDAQQTNISVASNNLANASTVGFKKGRAIFEDLLYQNVHQPGGRSSADTTLPSGLMLGAGTKVVATQKSFTQGDVQTTDNALDVMIDGRGFFEVQMPDGTTSYTRNGQFALNSEGTIVTSGAGYPILPEIQVPEGAKSITVSGDGQVSVTLTGDASGGRPTDRHRLRQPGRAAAGGRKPLSGDRRQRYADGRGGRCRWPGHHQAGGP